MKKTTSYILFTFIIVALLFTFSGCRKSSVIEEIIYDQTSKEIDLQSEIYIAEVDPNTEPEIDPNLPSRKEDKSNKKEKPKKEAENKGDENNAGEAAKTEADPTAKEKGAKAEDPNNEKDVKKEGNKDLGQSDDSAGESEDVNSRQVTDSTGKKIDLPENVNKVVAPANAAGIVQMLGGKNILAGSASDFTGDSLVKKVFADEGISSTVNLWDGDGSKAMSSANFQKLLTMKPDVCIGVGGEVNFSNAQIQELKKKKIAYITIPSMNTNANIISAVQIIGNLLSDRSKVSGGINAKSLASTYKDYNENLISKVTNKAGGRFTWDNIDYDNDLNVNSPKKFTGRTTTKGKYTLYVSEWDNSATYTMSHGGDVLLKETGIAVSPHGYSYSPISYYMSAAGALNNAARMNDDNKKEKHPVLPVNVNTVENSINGSSLSVYSNLNECFTRILGSGQDVALGEKDFPAIIVDNSSIKSKINSSDKLWKSHGKTSYGPRTDYGFIGDNGELVTSYIRGNYDVYVNPYGISSWTSGSQESVLETIWIANNITGVYGDSDVDNEVKNFYKTFYRHDLSSSELSQILGGK